MGHGAVPGAPCCRPRRIDPESGAARFYSLVVERDLFGQVVLVRNWGRIGTGGREMVEQDVSEAEALEAMDALSRRSVAEDTESFNERTPAVVGTGAEPESLGRHSGGS